MDPAGMLQHEELTLARAGTGEEGPRDRNCAYK